jgi:hypothetical protein
MAKAKSVYARRVRVLRQYWSDEVGNYVAEVEYLDQDETTARQLTLKEEIIVAMVQRHHRGGLPVKDTIAKVHRYVADPARWEAECKRRKIEPSRPPSRDTVARALRKASLIK